MPEFPVLRSHDCRGNGDEEEPIKLDYELSNPIAILLVKYLSRTSAITAAALDWLPLTKGSVTGGVAGGVAGGFWHLQPPVVGEGSWNCTNISKIRHINTRM
ncbi:hypothetical protein U1Q18_022523 [Sarracenia purpurea var. burkii]